MRQRRADVLWPTCTRLIALGVVGVVLASCGKKGPPLAPLVRLPAAVERVTATRLGHNVYLSLTIPAANVDRSTPVDIGYVEIYAFTGVAAPPRGMFLQQATPIARVPVLPAALPGEPARQASSDGSVAGATVTIVETVADPDNATARRFYLAVPFNTRERPGPQHTPVEVTFSPLPSIPSGLDLAYTASALTVTWTPGSAAVGGAAAPRVNVYRASPSGAEPATPIWQRPRPTPLNSEPLAAPPFSQPVSFGAETCYVLRSVIGEGAAAVESEPSPRACITPVDRFPPAAPGQLVAVATAGAINLLWEANADADLAGYLVLRGSVGDAMLQPLTPTPIAAVRFADTTVVSGIRYVYAVVAVDRAMPVPNTSPESARVEESAQ